MCARTARFGPNAWGYWFFFHGYFFQKATVRIAANITILSTPAKRADTLTDKLKREGDLIRRSSGVSMMIA
jgi:hypothetical protein